MKKKILALIATAAVAALMVPAFAFAADANNVDPEPCQQHQWGAAEVLNPESPACQQVIMAPMCTVCRTPDPENFEYLPATAEHQWGELEVRNKDAKACEDIEKIRRCTECSEPDFDNKVIVPATAEHQWSEPQILNNGPACVPVVKAPVCKVCNEIDNKHKETIPAAAEHEWVEVGVEEPAAPCGDTYKYFKCKNCGQPDHEVVAHGTGEHKPSKEQIINIADEDLPDGIDGCYVRYAYCVNCGQTAVEEFYHDWDGDTCKNCGKTRAAAPADPAASATSTATDSEPSVLAETGDPLNAGAFGFAAVAAALVGVVAFRRFNNAA